ncbi:9592_t:CDS:1, partial [Acaulospora morrowiae]
ELVSWVQRITLNVILRGYLGFGSNIYEEVSDVPRVINDIWTKSKEFNNNQQSIQELKCSLKNYLHSASLKKQEGKEDDTGNAPNVLREILKIAQKHLDNIQSLPQIESCFIKPTAEELGSSLNILLPAYETMWRVLLYAILETKVRGLLKKKNNKKPEETTEDNFLEDIDKDAKFLLDNPSYSLRKKNLIHYIVKETLRLYPATRHIHRVKDGIKYSINVEAIHRDPLIWGNDASRFKPERFENHIAKKDGTYIPFSIGPMQCIAADNFAPRLAAILIAAVISSVDFFDVVDNDAISKYGIDPDLPFENNRHAFENVFVNIATRSK